MALSDRIDAIMVGRTMSFHDLAMKLWPPSEHPRAWRYSSNGGPPGCFMALSACLRRSGFDQSYNGPGPGQRIVYPRRK